MKPAARLSDQCVHGGKIVTGSANVIVCSMPVARIGDGHVCPIPGHVAGKIVSGSMTVIVNGRRVARVGDTIACASPPSPAMGSPGGSAREYSVKPTDDPIDPGKTHQVSAEYKVKNEDNYQKALYLEHVSSDYDKDGSVDGHRIGGGLASLSGETKSDGHFGARGKMDVMTATAGVRASAHRGIGVQADAKATKATAGGSVYVGPKGDNGKNPYAEAGVEGKVLTAEADGELLAGDDGRRVGVALGGKAGASLAGGEVKGRTSIPVPFTNLSLDIKGAASGDVGAVGGELGAGAFYDKQESRFHLAGRVGLQAFLGGLGLKLDISFGKRYEQDDAGSKGGGGGGKPDTKGGATGPPPAPAPDAVAMGCSCVIIGG